MQKTKILTIDVETTPQVGYFWGKKYETNIIEVIEPTYIMSFSAKWLGGKHITKGWPDYKGYKPGVKDDKALVTEMWELLNEADIIVTQNGRAFDSKIFNTRRLAHKLPPCVPYKVIDTLIENRRLLQMPSYSLDDICAYYGIGRKQEHEGFNLWKKCMAGDLSAWKRMLKYNKHDVTLTEKLYLLIRSSMKNHPNIGNYLGKECCPKCGSKKIQYRGYARNATTVYRRFQCECGAWGRTTKNIQENKPLVSI